ncbi:DNA mismatch repair domain protein [[Eubacterium] yurii subsp. margaretiae ATCC 43715]|nr:DNA mismatch repair domain protein [[Eubacterium] yurii subsp. margaretiae ATCC 43715]
MQNVIKKLDDNIVKLISAGEVIESPCSVVKELVENSIDSKATSVVVEIKNGGKSYIRVTDNGCGIGEEYVIEAFKKHTTSKISTFDDFINIGTNGFRGEALASISAVAKISMTTKTADSNYGITVVMNNDKLLEKTKTGAKDGTTVIVEELLENVPARKNFLKSDKAEGAKITDFLIRYALANPNIKIRYINNSKQVFATYATGKVIDVVDIIFGEKHGDKIIEVDEKLSDFLSIRGIIGNNSAMYSSRKMQYIFVNGRIIKDKNITAYIENAYKKFIPSGNYPLFFLDIIIKPSMVDVNIHPNKLEVKFSEEKLIYSLIENAISNKLDNHNMIPTVNIAKEEKEEENIFNDILVNYKNRVQKKEEKKIRPIEEYEEQKIVISKQRQDEEFVYKVDVSVSEAKVEEDKKKYNSENEDRQKEEMVSAEEQVRNNVSEITPLEVNTLSIPKRVVEKEIKTSDKKINSVDLTLLSYGGRVFDTYIMLYNDEDMYIIDQHAAHERILYERFLREFYSNSIVQQQLLIPQNVVIPVNLVDYSQSIIEEASSFGFECDLFGDNIILVRAIPDFLDMEASLRFLDEVFNIYLEEKLSLELIKDKIATKACKAAIKGNDTSIKEEEIEKIIYDLEHCENKFACPHGRPVITRLSKYEMEKFFKRIL